MAGRGKTTMDWFVHTFKPTIDKQYRTLPARPHTFIAGSCVFIVILLNFQLIHECFNEKRNLFLPAGLAVVAAAAPWAD